MPRSCALLGGLQSVYGLRWYGNITRTRNVSEYMLVLAVRLVKVLRSTEFQADLRLWRWHAQSLWCNTTACDTRTDGQTYTGHSTHRQSRKWVTQSNPWPKWPTELLTHDPWPMWPMTRGSPGPSPHTSASLTQIYRLPGMYMDIVYVHTPLSCYIIAHVSKLHTHTGTCKFRVC